MRRPGLSVLFATAVLALGAAASAGAHPISSGRIAPRVAVDHAGAAPTTADCLEQIGISCYAPFQLQRAYGLQPLYDAGLDGSGKTIVIVDSFGSPTIREDLAQFDEDFGLP